DLAMVDPDPLQRSRQLAGRWSGQAGSGRRGGRAGRGGGSLADQAIAGWLADRHLGLGGDAHVSRTLVDGARCATVSGDLTMTWRTIRFRAMYRSRVTPWERRNVEQTWSALPDAPGAP